MMSLGLKRGKKKTNWFLTRNAFPEGHYMGQHQITDENREIGPKARHMIHKVLVDWFSRQLPGRLLAMRLQATVTWLDISAGWGTMLFAGRSPQIFLRLKGSIAFTRISIRRIDAPDNSFDYVCCVEGLEHMTNPYRAVEEFARVLKTGGTGVFTIPNYSNIEKRLKYLLKGYLTKPKTVEDYKREGSNLFNFHNSPLTITILDLMFEINGLKVTAILRDKRKTKQNFLLPLVFLLKASACLSSRRSKKKHAYDLTLKNEVILGGNTLIFITKKSQPMTQSEQK